MHTADESPGQFSAEPPRTEAQIHFIRLPSIAERKLGPDYVAPVRLDPRILDQMQQTIRDLAAKYAETLTVQIDTLFALIGPACTEDSEARARLYALVHDIRGLAGTFGHAIAGRFANSLCLYMETSAAIDSTILRFHIEAMRDALLNPEQNDVLAAETLRSLERLIQTARREERYFG